MKVYIISIFAFCCISTSLNAQQPQWELFFPNLSGPIAVDPTDSDIIYIAGDSCDNCANTGMWKTTDGGQTWNFYDEGWGMGRPAHILINPDNPQEILVGGAPFVAVQKSTDGGQTWINASNGIRTDHHGYDVRQLAYDRLNRIYYLADLGGGAFCGVYRSVDGINWELTSFYGCPTSVLVNASTGDVFASSDVEKIRKSADYGETWIDISNGLPTDPFSPPIGHLEKVPNSESMYCTVANYGIYKTFNGGENWFSVNDSVTGQFDFRGGLVVSETDTNTVFAATWATSDSTQPGGLYVSRNGGNSWDLLRNGLPDSVIDVAAYYLFLDSHRNILYASMAMFGPQSPQQDNIYRMRDAIVTKVEDTPNSSPELEIALRSYPNPFNSETSLLYSVPKAGRIIITIYNILGKEVIPVSDELVSPGEYFIHWDGRNREGIKMPSGIYLARMQLGQDVTTIKLLMLK